MKTVNLLFPHQLFLNSPLLKNGNPVYLVEEKLFFKEFNFHKTKLVFHRASMKSYESELIKMGLHVTYISTSDKNSDCRVLIKDLFKKGFGAIEYHNPTDNWLEKRIKTSATSEGIQLIEHENLLFINSREDLKTFFKPTKKSFFQTSFYKQQRVKHEMLLEGTGNPLGGSWSFDADNRKKYPKSKVPPAIFFPEKDKIWNEACAYVEKQFPSNLGELPTAPIYPYSRKETDKWLRQFFEKRFHEFGPYEDAIVKEELILNHSVLSPMINSGLITPMEIIESAVKYADKNKVPINSLEGFVRQIVGWREFIRGMYECKGTESRKSNFWGFERKIPASFYSGTTGIIPIDTTIKKVLKYGYCHHIERLMVLGNFMLLCEFHPNEVYRWFMELFIDAYDWVMVPNIYGMSQFADGGFFATKPYISGSNYVLKMSNYSKGDWQKPWDGLFWRFMHSNRDFFKKNPRLSMLLGALDRMDDDKREKHFEAASKFLDSLK